MTGKDKNGSNLIKFSAMTIQMAVLIGGGAWGGSALDAKMQNSKPIFTIIFSLLGIGLSLYFVIRDAGKISK